MRKVFGFIALTVLAFQAVPAMAQVQPVSVQKEVKRGPFHSDLCQTFYRDMASRNPNVFYDETTRFICVRAAKEEMAKNNG